jgi:tetratricopeptide (TPR) repeat protein
VPAGLDGVALCPLLGGPILGGEPQQPLAAYLESMSGLHGYGWAPLSGLRTERWKLILAPTPELYDLVEDPGEERNVYAREEATIRELTRRLDSLGRRPGGEADASPDAGVVAALRDLGYVSGMHSPAEPSSLPDPKDRLDQLSLFELAEEEFLAGNRTSALALLDVVLAADPDQPYANLRSGQILAQAGRLDEAVDRLRTVLAWDPRQAEASYQLADALTRAGRLDEAAAQWRRTTELQPLRTAAWTNLGVVLLGQSGPAASVEALVQAVSLDPDDPAARRNLAAARYRLALEQAAAGESAEARRTLEAACLAQPELRQRAAMDPRLAALLVDG